MKTDSAHDRPAGYPLRSTPTFEEERREVFTSVLECLRRGPLDNDGIAACAYLLRHLVRTGRRGV